MKFISIHQTNKWIICVLIVATTVSLAQDETLRVDDAASLETTLSFDNINLTSELSIPTQSIEIEDPDITMDDLFISPDSFDQSEKFDELLELLDELDIGAETVDRAIIPDKVVDTEEESIEPTPEVPVVVDMVQATDADEKPIEASQLQAVPIVPYTPPLPEIVIESEDEIIEDTVIIEAPPIDKSPKVQPFFAVNMDYHALNFATNKRYDPFAGIHGASGLSIHIKGLEFMVALSAINQDYNVSDVFEIFQTTDLSYRMLGGAYQTYISQKLSLQAGFWMSSLSGTYMGTTITDATQQCVYMGINIDVWQSLTLKLAAIPYLKTTFELGQTTNEDLYAFIENVPVETVEYMNNYMASISWEVPYFTRDTFKKKQSEVKMKSKKDKKKKKKKNKKKKKKENSDNDN